MKIKFRPATRADIPAIQDLHERQQAMQGTAYEGPAFDGRCIIDAVVGESDGEIVGLFFCEAVAELKFVAVDPRFTAHAQREVGSLSKRLKAQGFRYIECCVPQQLKRYISKPLQRAGFENKESELAYFSLDMRADALGRV